MQPDQPGGPDAAAAPPLGERILDQLAEGVFLVDATRPGCPIIYANEALGRLTGYDPGALIGRTIGSFQGPNSDPTMYAAVQAACTEQRPWSGELLMYRKDGTPAWHKLRLVPIPDASGRPGPCLGIQVDVTETRNLQDRLRQAEKMAALGFLAAGIAHDFNNLLTAILAYSEILQEEPLPRAVREGLDKIQEAGLRGATMTQQLLNLSRKQLPTPLPMDLGSVVAGMESVLRRLVGEEIQLVTWVEPIPEPVEVVPGQVEQILLNLVVNARDAMPAGGQITIELRTRNPDPGRVRGPGPLRPGPYVLLAVTDTGCGMSEEVLAELFQPLFTTKAAGQGTGLGLFTVHEIVKRHGGLMAVASQPNRGTRIEIFFPQGSGTYGATT